MSRAHATVTFPDGLVLHAEYDSTLGVIRPTLRDSRQEVEQHWRQTHPWRQCACGQPETVQVRAEHGDPDDPISWAAEACRACRVVTRYFSKFARQQEFEEQQQGSGYGLAPPDSMS